MRKIPFSKVKPAYILIPLVVLTAGMFTISAFAAETSGGHWWDAFSWFGDIANFVKYLVVPAPKYFHNRLAKLNSLVNEKFAGLGQLFQTLNDFFYKIGDPAPADFKVRIPDDFLFQGYRGFSMDFFGSAAPYLRFLRAFLTAACFILTAVVCYNKLRKFFTEEE